MTPSMYDQWAEIYDSVYSYVTDDIPFYVEEALRAGGPVLELGCGTGRVAIPIADAGVDVVGLDSSPAMLEVARRKIECSSEGANHLTLVEADMRDLASLDTLDIVDKKFGLAIIPFRGFLALLSVEDQIRTLDGIRRRLIPGGRLVFNVFVADAHMLVQEGDVPYHLRDVTDSETGRKLVLWQQSTYDHYNQVTSVRIIVEELDDSGAVNRRTYKDFQLRYAHRWEIEHLLVRCGYEVLDLFGDFDRSPFDESSTEMVWVARPRK